MRRSVFVMIVVFSFIASCLAVSAIASADEETFSETLGPLEYLRIPFESSTDLVISWNVDAVGNPIDVYLIDDDQLSSFQNEIDFEYHDDLSVVDVSRAEASGVLQPGKYHLIFVNGYDSGTIAFTAHLSLDYGPAANALGLITLLVIFTVVGIVVVYFIIRSRREKQPMYYVPPPPPQMPYQPYQYQQGPQRPGPPPATIYCPNCRALNPPESMFCKQCGTRLK